MALSINIDGCEVNHLPEISVYNHNYYLVISSLDFGQKSYMILKEDCDEYASIYTYTIYERLPGNKPGNEIFSWDAYEKIKF